MCPPTMSMTIYISTTKSNNKREMRRRRRVPVIDEMTAALQVVSRLLAVLRIIGLVTPTGQEQLGGRRDVRVDEAVGPLADSHPLQRVMEGGQLLLAERVGNVAQLIGVDPHVVVRDKARDELAVERIVRRVERADAPIRVVIGVHAHAKGPLPPQRSRAPVVVVVTEAVHLVVTALAVVSLRHGPLPAQLLLATLLTLFLDLAPARLTHLTLLRSPLVPRPVDVHARTHSKRPRPVRPATKEQETMNIINIKERKRKEEKKTMATANLHNSNGMAICPKRGKNVRRRVPTIVVCSNDFSRSQSEGIKRRRRTQVGSSREKMHLISLMTSSLSLSPPPFSSIQNKPMEPVSIPSLLLLLLLNIFIFLFFSLPNGYRQQQIHLQGRKRCSPNSFRWNLSLPFFPHCFPSIYPFIHCGCARTATPCHKPPAVAAKNTNIYFFFKKHYLPTMISFYPQDPAIFCQRHTSLSRWDGTEKRKKEKRT